MGVYGFVPFFAPCPPPPICLHRGQRAAPLSARLSCCLACAGREPRARGASAGRGWGPCGAELSLGPWPQLPVAVTRATLGRTGGEVRTKVCSDRGGERFSSRPEQPQVAPSTVSASPLGFSKTLLGGACPISLHIPTSRGPSET